MTDKELLELAAKAAGIADYDYDTHEYGKPVRYWNALTNDGDALRLAVKLSIHLAMEAESAGVVGAMWNFDECGTAQNIVEEDAPIDGDDYAATRRAIVRAAAEIGKAKQ